MTGPALVVLVALSVLGATRGVPEVVEASDSAKTKAAKPEALRDIRGITISCPGSGREWASDAMPPTVDAVKAVNGNWLTVHPYARISSNGSVGRSRYRVESGVWREHIARPIRDAHARGVKAMMKPHLAYWGSPFSWRGEITFKTEEEWTRFFEEYETWIVSVAAVAKDADLFVVGTELDKMIHRDAEWRRIIAKVREVYSGPVTYAANWTDFERVEFWDALDLVGIQGYFPVVSPPHEPTPELIRQGWARATKFAREFSKKVDRPILLTEFGYTRSMKAAYEPWAYETHGPEAEPLQIDLLRIGLDAIEKEPAIVGSFLWKWFPEGYPQPRNFNMQSKAVRALLRETWPAAKKEG